MMKYAIAIALTLIAMAASAAILTWSKNKKFPPNEATSSYRVPTISRDIRAYEWTPKGNPETFCIMAFLETRPVGLQCVPKVSADELEE